jgi:hypothetical protein
LAGPYCRFVKEKVKESENKLCSFSLVIPALVSENKWEKNEKTARNRRKR